MIKKKVVFILSAVFFTAALGLLITAMIVHAVRGAESSLAGLFAIASAAVSFTGFIIILITGKGKGEENENKQR